MAKCDLCGESCPAFELEQLRDAYQVPGVVDLCKACSRWADKTKSDMVAEITPRMKQAVEDRRISYLGERKGWFQRLFGG